MLSKEKILEIAKTKGKVTTMNIAASFRVSRQYVSHLVKLLVSEGRLLKIGSTRKSFYVLPEYAESHQEISSVYFKKTYKNFSLEEHKVLDEIRRKSPLLYKLSENVQSIFTYAFSEMFNNAIEHSQSKSISVEVLIHDGILAFTVNDPGIGVFKSIMNKNHLNSELEAIQELLKGKITTMPKSHSGEGIFFTSRAADNFILDSYGYELIFNNTLPDIFVQKVKKIKKGTKVRFSIKTTSSRHLSEIFREYADIDGSNNYGFDKTEIQVKLYTVGGVHISRSQARRILSGLEKFKIVLFDYDKVEVVGQAFADEIYRVFHNKHPEIKLENTNMNEGVKFMIDRAITEAAKGR
jgi:anti-sigma regulatory factor (Ser/Thr protein kinase)